MVSKKIGNGFGYDFRLLGKRHRKARFRTRGEAQAAEKLKRAEVLEGRRRVTFAEAFEKYMAGTKMTATTADGYRTFYEKNIRKHIGHLFLEEVRTDVLDTLKADIPEHLGPKSINQRLIVVRATLRFAVKREWIDHAPFVPMEKVPKKHPDWYSLEERDAFLNGMFELQPQWYLYFYVTMRLGLRRGELCALEHKHFQRARGLVVVEQAAEPGNKDRPAIVKLRKADDTMSLGVTPDVFDAYDWHVQQGYAGKRYVFFVDDVIPKALAQHGWPLKQVQKAHSLRRLSHHVIGRHSVASQALDGGAHMKAIQAQLGHLSEQSTHKYAHVKKDAQRAIVEQLRPDKAPHELN